jgi:hypothetical protein
MKGTLGHRESGQAAVESALTLPLVLFLLLGTLQLFLLLQAKVMAQCAVFQANRVGSVMHGRCDAMTQAAILALTPTIRPFLGPSFGGSPGQRLGAAFRLFKDNHYGNFRDWSRDEAIVWIIREQPRFPGTDPVRAQREFDRLLAVNAEPVRLELRMIYWCPLLIPFADWVFSRMAMSDLAIRTYTAQNSLMLTQQARWTPGPTRLRAEIANEYAPPGGDEALCLSDRRLLDHADDEPG